VAGLRPVKPWPRIERLPFFLEKHMRTTYNEKGPKTAHLWDHARYRAVGHANVLFKEMQMSMKAREALRKSLFVAKAAAFGREGF
jgi:hypothetical protein